MAGTSMAGAAKNLRQTLHEMDLDDVLVADGFDSACLGVVERCGQPSILLYDAERCVRILMKRDKMTEEEAWEYFSYNVSGAWVGDGTPGWLVTRFTEAGKLRVR